MTLNVDRFIQAVGNAARPSLFNIHLNFPTFVSPNLEKTSLLCKAGSLPASNLSSIPIAFKGGRQAMVNDTRVFEPWAVTIINNTDFAIRNNFEIWMNAMNGHQSNEGVTNPSEYQVDLTVEQLDKDGSILKTYDIVGAFPTLCGAIEVSYDATGQVEEFGVEFALQYWKSHTTS